MNGAGRENIRIIAIKSVLLNGIIRNTIPAHAAKSAPITTNLKRIVLSTGFISFTLSESS